MGVIYTALGLVDFESRKRIESLFQGLLAKVVVAYISGLASDGGSSSDPCISLRIRAGLSSGAWKRRRA